MVIMNSISTRKWQVLHYIISQGRVTDFNPTTISCMNISLATFSSLLRYCHTLPRFTALAQPCLLSQTAVRSQEDLIFFVKTGMSHRFHSYWAAMAFYRVPSDFLFAIVCAFISFLLRTRHFHCAHTALMACWKKRIRAVETQWHLRERRTISMQVPPTITTYGYTEPRVRCVLCILKVRAVAWRSTCMPSHSLYRRSYCVGAGMLAIVLRTSRRFACFLGAVGSQPWCDRV